MADLPKILKHEEGSAVREIRAFEVQDLRNPGPLVYQTPSLRNAPAAQGQKEKRFHFDDLLKDVLSTDEETEKLIDSRVEERVAEIRDSTRTQAQEEGYQAGFSRGEAEAKAKFEEEAHAIIAQIQGLLDSVESRKDELYAAQSGFLHELMFRFAEVILQREIATDKDYLRRKVNEIVERLGAKEMVKIIVHPSQIEHIQAVVPELQEKFASLRSVTIEASEQIESTDCVVETDFNRVDATLETQLKSLHDHLSGVTGE